MLAATWLARSSQLAARATVGQLVGSLYVNLCLMALKRSWAGRTVR